jgi:hypothetical protein
MGYISRGFIDRILQKINFITPGTILGVMEKVHSVCFVMLRRKKLESNQSILRT